MSNLAKRKNVEKRREKSKYAARYRRGRESEIFQDVEEIVPLGRETPVTHVDRIAVLRLAAALCRSRRFMPTIVGTAPAAETGLGATLGRALGCGDGGWGEEAAALALPGFLLVTNRANTIVYISQGVSNLIGLTQTDLMGLSLEDFVKTSDLTALREATAASRLPEFQITMRIKSVLTARGRNLNLRSATYKAMRWTVKLVSGSKNGSILLYGEPIMAATTAAQQQTLDAHATDTFVTRHTPDLKFSYCHERASKFLGHDIKTLMGSSFFSLVHPADLPDFAKSIRELHDKGQCRTGYFRLVGDDGEPVWVQTEASLTNQTARGGKGVGVVACHHVIGQRGGGTRRFRSGGSEDRRPRLASPHSGSPPPPLLSAHDGPRRGSRRRQRPASPIHHTPVPRHQRPSSPPSVAAPAAPEGGDEPDEGGQENAANVSGGPCSSALWEPLRQSERLPALLTLDEILDQDSEMPSRKSSFDKIRDWLLQDYRPTSAMERLGEQFRGVVGRGEGTRDPAPAPTHPAAPAPRGPGRRDELGPGDVGERGAHVPKDNGHAPPRRQYQAEPPGARLGSRRPAAATGAPRAAVLPTQVLSGYGGERQPGPPLSGSPQRKDVHAALSPARPPFLVRDGAAVQRLSTDAVVPCASAQSLETSASATSLGSTDWPYVGSGGRRLFLSDAAAVPPEGLNRHWTGVTVEDAETLAPFVDGSVRPFFEHQLHVQTLDWPDDFESPVPPAQVSPPSPQLHSPCRYASQPQYKPVVFNLPQ